MPVPMRGQPYAQHFSNKVEILMFKVLMTSQDPLGWDQRQIMYDTNLVDSKISKMLKKIDVSYVKRSEMMTEVSRTISLQCLHFSFLFFWCRVFYIFFFTFLTSQTTFPPIITFDYLGVMTIRSFYSFIKNFYSCLY